ncbi:MAG: hypothetical protein N2B05_09225, partial [Gemmatimonadales bacterium]
ELDAIAAQPRRSRWPVGIAALVGVLLLGLGAWWTLSRTGPGARSYDSIAVFPFANLSEDASNQSFSDGLADELLNALAGVENLKVAGRTSTFALRDQNLDLRAIGDTLGVETVLEGSVRRSEDRVRITAQLIDAETGFHLWSQEYDRDVTDIFAVQEDLARSIVRALIPKLAGGGEDLYRGGTSDVEAYDLYLAGREKWYTREIQLLWEAVDDFEAAVALDPGFALGWSGISDAIDALAYRDSRGQALVPRARMAAQKAVLLDPDLAEGWASWGVLAMEADRDWGTAEIALKRAIALKPSYAYARAMLSNVYRDEGRMKEAIELQRSALALDPLSPVINGILGISLVAARQFDEGRAQIDRTLATGDPEFAHAALLIWGEQLGLTGEEMANHAVILVRSLGASDPEVAAAIGHALAGGREDEELRSSAMDAMATLIADSVFTIRQITSLYVGLGAEEEALRWLGSDAARADLSLSLLGFDPALDPLRDDPRMQALMDEYGFPNGYNPATDTYEPETRP